MAKALHEQAAEYIRSRILTGEYAVGSQIPTENELCAAAGRETHQGDFYLPLDRDSYDIPITISDGTGTVVLTARSTSGTMVPVVEQATVNATYTDWEYFFE